MMKMNIKIIGIIIALILVSNFSFGQMSFVNNRPDRDYKKSGMSSKMRIKKGDTKKKDLRLREGYAYFINVSAKTDVHFRLRKDGKIIYDNSLFEYSKTKNISCYSQQTITIEILSDPDKFSRKRTKHRKVNFTLSYKKIENYEKNNNNNIPAYALN